MRQKLANRNCLPEALRKNIVMIGWCRAEKLLHTSSSGYYDALKAIYPEYPLGLIRQGSGEMRRFIHEMRKGDIIIVSESGKPALYCAEALDDEILYDHSPDAQANDNAFRRRVRWLFSGKAIPKDMLPEDILASINTRYTIRNLGDTSPEARYFRLLVGETGKEFEKRPELAWTEDVQRIVKARVNAREFRLVQMETHNETCCISGISVREALEAAHIVPYAGNEPDRDHRANGLLLRADIHKLFDRHLISIHPDDLTVRVSATLAGTDYAAYEGKKLALEASRAKIQVHYCGFEAMEKKKAPAVRQGLVL